ncbi:hypothetical protein GW17_00047700 [Ensete ventricosum]|nr:hypothetical protein GW17_00047700 [Ensete ventricosum]
MTRPSIGAAPMTRPPTRATPATRPSKGAAPMAKLVGGMMLVTKPPASQVATYRWCRLCIVACDNYNNTIAHGSYSGYTASLHVVAIIVSLVAMATAIPLQQCFLVVVNVN